MVRDISATLPEASMLPLDDHSDNGLDCLHADEVNPLPSPVAEEMFAPGSIPSSPVPRAFDPDDLLTEFLAFKLKLADSLIASDLQDVRFRSEQQRQLHEEVGKKIIEAAHAMTRSKKSSGIMKFFGWLAVGLTVAAAVASGGTLAIVAAGVAVGVAVLNETGVVDKMTQAIAKSLMKDQAMDANSANVLAVGITIAIMFAVSALTIGAGSANLAGNGLRTTGMLSRLGQAGASTLRGLASLANRPGELGIAIARILDQAASDLASAASNASKIAQIRQRVSTAARIGEGVAAMGQAAAGSASAVQAKQAADSQAEAVDIGRLLTKLSQLQSDDMDFIKNLVDDRAATIQRVAEAIESQSNSNATLIRNFA